MPVFVSWYLRSLTATLLLVYYHVSMVQGESCSIHVLHPGKTLFPLRKKVLVWCRWCRGTAAIPAERAIWCVGECCLEQWRIVLLGIISLNSKLAIRPLQR